jgi:hypothetical protein
MAAMSVRSVSSPDLPARPSPVGTFGIIGLLVALALNLGLFVVADEGGVSFRLFRQADVFITFQELTTGYRTMEIGNVLLVTAVLFVIGLGLFGLAARRSRSAGELVLVLAGLTTLCAVGLARTLRADAAAIAVMVAMAVVAGLAFVISLMPALPRAHRSVDERRSSSRRMRHPVPRQEGRRTSPRTETPAP